MLGDCKTSSSRLSISEYIIKHTEHMDFQSEAKLYKEFHNKKGNQNFH